MRFGTSLTAPHTRVAGIAHPDDFAAAASLRSETETRASSWTLVLVWSTLPAVPHIAETLLGAGLDIDLCSLRLA